MKSRVDALLVERGLAESRSKAQAMVLAGEVYIGEERVDKPGTQIASNSDLRVREKHRFASRGGLKLQGAIDQLGLDAGGVVCADLGASTGGFTDCLLKRGASRVFAVDVGRGQLDARLSSDPRVEVRDETNARYLEASDFDVPLDLVTVDVSFIGIDKIAPALARILPTGGLALVLIKPQFEVGKEVARRSRGVIRDATERQAAIERAAQTIESAGFEITARCDAPVPGPKGNLEHFVLAKRL